MRNLELMQDEVELLTEAIQLARHELSEDVVVARSQRDAARTDLEAVQWEELIFRKHREDDLLANLRAKLELLYA